MARARVRRRAASAPAVSGPPPRWAFLLPSLVAVLLSAPCLPLGYFWDDYLFLTLRGTGDARSLLLPAPGEAFYRPVAQGIYFLFLRAADPSSGTLGHLVNLAALASAIALLVHLVRRLSGPRAGLIAGLVFACFGAAPSLVAWVSASQDLFAIVLVLAAFLLRHEGRPIAALLCGAAAVLCKEPAVAAFPVLAFWDRIVGREPGRPWAHAAAYGVVLLLWMLVHPGIGALLGRGFQSGATGYVGLAGPERGSEFLVRYAMTLANLPPLGFGRALLDDRVPYGLAALAAMLGGLWYLDGRLGGPRTDAVPIRRTAWIAALFGIPTLLLPALLVAHWAPYFACIPAVGLAILLGPLLARRRTLVVSVVLAIFLLLGVRYRSARALDEPAWTEPVFVEAADAVSRVRANFKTLFPTFPRGSQIVVSTASSGSRGIHGTLVGYQALRVWYGDPTLRAVTTLKRRPGAAAEYLIRVSTDLDVLAIDPETRRVRSATPQAPDLSEIDRPLRNYARAVAAGGDPDRAIRILQSLGRSGSPESQLYSERLIAMIHLAAGRRDEAARILAAAPALPRDVALALVKRLLAEATESEPLDRAAFEAFGLSEDDPETVRWMVRDFGREGLAAQAAWYADRLERLLPGDSEAAEVLSNARKRGIRPSRAPE